MADPKQQQQQAPRPAGRFDNLAVPAPDVPTLRALFQTKSVQESIAEVIPKHMEPDRMVQVMLTCCRKIPNLMKCSMQSLISALVACSELGLEPGGALGHINLIPFWNSKANRFDINIIVGYKGYVELARRSGRLKSISARVVHEKDKFTVKFGLEEKLEHEPYLDGDPGKARFVYCVAQFTDGGYHFEVMSIPEVEKIRDATANYKNAKDKEGSVWGQHFEEMAKKTAVRRASKYLPLSAEQADALEKNDDAVVEGSVVARDVVAGALAAGTKAPERMDVVIPFPTADAEPAHDPTTGEVIENESAPVDETPPTDPAENLLWRIARASADQLADLTKEAGKLPKDEPRRGDVGTAISRRREELK